jgi:hypothetical protein
VRKPGREKTEAVKKPRPEETEAMLGELRGELVK